ncbi:CDC27 family protein [Sulfurimonas sp.]|uniref:CDC27 family protein n=1 Tax=Sulfurimonas sp. TaxID=2022749 RepID=UPI003565249B
MHNIHELEQRWLKYKIKFFLPYFITVFFLIILAITLYFIFDSKKENNILTKQEIKKEEPLLTVKKEITETIKEVPVQNIQVKLQEPTLITEPTKIEEKTTSNKNIILTPSLDFMKKLRTDSFNSYNDQVDREYQQSSQKIYKNKEDLIEEDNLEIEQNTEKPKISITRQEDHNDIKDVIKRFKKNNNPTLSLFVAKKYYKLGEYQKAYNYALITNEINNEIEDSWIIFAKSLVKLNKRDKAIQTLTKYVNHSGSGNAKVLLDDIKAGKFK